MYKCSCTGAISECSVGGESGSDSNVDQGSRILPRFRRGAL
jgi:hypothetical protein